MSTVNNPNKFLLSIEEPTQAWPWPSEYYFLGGCVFQQSNDEVELVERDINQLDAIKKYDK